MKELDDIKRDIRKISTLSHFLNLLEERRNLEKKILRNPGLLEKIREDPQVFRKLGRILIR